MGIVLAILTAPMLLAAIWGEIGRAAFWRMVGTLEVTAVAVAHASLLLRATLRPARRWMLTATLLGMVLLSALILGLVWDAVRDDSIWRPLGILSILTCAGTILVWVFHRIDRGPLVAVNVGAGRAGPPPPPPTSSSPPPSVRHCVACGADRIEVTARGVDCYSCGAHFRVTSG